MQEVYEFLKEAKAYYLATVEGDQPRVRPFGTYLIFNNKLYIQTSKEKPCSKQMAANPKIEICTMKPDGTWIRIAATAVNDDSVEVKQAVLDDFPMLKDRYSAEDEKTQVLYLSEATATFFSFASEPRTVTF
ncbi:MAG: pyridoxamine 5'-phosphate oxidase family protein [Oscillospiraceae bacterium]|nr:pyridoxamine 5'-phosphate oxidase family protein [Oscillospiraceae bacterium]